MIHIAPLNDKKYIKRNQKRFTSYNINSGSCKYDEKTAEILIWRKEELIKTIIHECLHGLNVSHITDDKDISSIELNEWSIYGLEALSGKGPLIKPLIWNAGVYLWFSGLANDIKEGIKKAEFCVSSGLAQNTLTQLIQWRKKII